MSDFLKVYLVADPEHAVGDLYETVEAALSGGVTAVQLRSKSGTDREKLARGERLSAICERFGAMFIVNDRLDLALAVNAGGVHLGVDDLPVSTARAIAPNSFHIGFSPETDSDTRNARSAGASYLGIGPVFGTRSKSDAGQAIGLDAFAHRARISEAPVIGIGGINAGNARSVIEAGAAGVAVMSTILASDSPFDVAEELRREVEAAGKHG